VLIVGEWLELLLLRCAETVRISSFSVVTEDFRRVSGGDTADEDDDILWERGNM